MVDLIIAAVAGAVATVMLHYAWGHADLVLGAGVSFLIWISLRINKT
jgi:hypothetical protein